METPRVVTKTANRNKNRTKSSTPARKKKKKKKETKKSVYEYMKHKNTKRRAAESKLIFAHLYSYINI